MTARLTAGGETLEPHDLEVLSLLRDWSARAPERVGRREAERLEAVLWRLLPPPDAAPSRATQPQSPLWEAYRRRLTEEE